MALNIPENQARFLESLLSMTKVAPEASVRQLTILMAVGVFQGLTSKQVADLCGESAPVVTRAVDVWDEYIERRPVPGDRRARSLHLTREGRAFVKKLMSAISRETPSEIAGLIEEKFF